MLHFCIQNNKGLGDLKNAIKYMLISTLSFSMMSAMVKYLNDFSSFQLVFFRSLGTLILTFSYLRLKSIPIAGNNISLLIVRGLIGVTAMSLFFISIKYLSLGAAVTIRYISPIFAAIFAALLFKDKIRPLQWLLFAIAFAGVYILKGYGADINPTGLMIALTSAFFSGMVYVIIYKIGKSEHPVVIVNYFMFIATVVGGLLSIPSWQNPIGLEWLYLLGLGILGFFGQIYMTKAFQIVKTDKVAPLKYIEVVFTAVLGIFWFGDVYTVFSILGIVMIIGALILNILYKAKV